MTCGALASGNPLMSRLLTRSSMHCMQMLVKLMRGTPERGCEHYGSRTETSLACNESCAAEMFLGVFNIAGRALLCYMASRSIGFHQLLGLTAVPLQVALASLAWPAKFPSLVSTLTEQTTTICIKQQHTQCSRIHMDANFAQQNRIA